MKRRLMQFISLVFGLFAGILPIENEMSSHLMHDGKADGPTTYPGGLLVGLSGVKEDAGAIDAAAKTLQAKLEGIKGDMKRELEALVGTRVDAMSKEKLDKMTADLEKVTNDYKSSIDKVAKMETDFNQKLAAIQTPTQITGEKEVNEQKRLIAGRMVSHFMRTSGMNSGLKEKYEKLQGVEGFKADFLVGSNTFIIPAEISAVIDNVLSKESGVLDSIEVVTTTVRDYRKIINRRGTGLGKAAESTVRAVQDAPLLAEVEPSYGELYSRYYIAQHALDDSSFDVEKEFLASTGVDMAESLDTDFVTGDGTNTIKGLNAFALVNAPTWGSIERVQTAGAIAYADLLNVVFTPRARYRRNAKWLIPKALMPQILVLEDTNGNLVFTPPRTQSEVGILLGYPVIESESFGSITPDGSRQLYFGDFKRGYLLHRVRDTRMIRDPFTKKGYVEFYVWNRTGGTVADYNALVCLQKTIGTS